MPRFRSVDDFVAQKPETKDSNARHYGNGNRKERDLLEVVGAAGDSPLYAADCDRLLPEIELLDADAANPGGDRQVVQSGLQRFHDPRLEGAL